MQILFLRRVYKIIEQILILDQTLKIILIFSEGNKNTKEAALWKNIKNLVIKTVIKDVSKNQKFGYMHYFIKAKTWKLDLYAKLNESRLYEDITTVKGRASMVVNITLILHVWKQKYTFHMNFWTKLGHVKSINTFPMTRLKTANRNQTTIFKWQWTLP